MRGKSFRTIIMDDSSAWESLEQAIDKYIKTVNEVVEMIRELFGVFNKLMETLAEAISDQVRVELSRQKVKRHPPLNLVQTYSFIPRAKKNLPYQRRNY